MRILLISTVIAVIVGAIVVSVWRRPDPKHVFMFSLVAQVSADNPTLSDADADHITKPNEG